MEIVIKTKRVYEKPLKKDGCRILIDRIWPRGISKKVAKLNDWNIKIAPTVTLRKWFNHDPELWAEFQKKYVAELKKNEAVAFFVKNHLDTKVITLIYAGNDKEHTHALVLQQYLVEKFNEI
ncbi:MAG: DUF488 family protein [Bacteroidia bacterium]